MRDDVPLTRRQALLGGTVGFATLLAGCTSSDDSDDGTGNGNETGTGDSDDGDGEEDGDGGDGGEGRSFETKQLGPAVGTPPWYRADETLTGAIFLHDSPGDVRAGSDAVDIEFGDEDIEQFVDETDFGSQRLVRVEAVGANGCYDRVEFDGLTVEDGTVTGEATATDPGDADACDHAITFPRAFVRVDDPVEDAELDVTDGWGNTRTVRSDDQPRFDPDELDGAVAPAGDPPAVPAPLECEGLDRKGQASDEADIVLGNADDSTFALRVEEPSYEYGDTATIRLTNTTMDWRVTGNRYKYNVQVQTEDGWQEVRAIDGSPPFYTDEGILHPPGEGFEWKLELTEEGLLADHIHEDILETCPELGTGRYRFVYWPTDLAVEFDLVG